MSPDALEVARTLFDAFNRAFTDGDRDLYELLDPDVEWMPVLALLEGTTYRGVGEVEEWIRDLKQDWAAFEADPADFRDLGDGRVLVLGAWRAQGRRAEVLLDFPQAAWLIHARAGRVSRLQSFTDRRAAFEAVGLEN
jgi:ketosteroid isomerase-like protein